jgi:DNA-binding LytR/AlgR family response regulator
MPLESKKILIVDDEKIARDRLIRFLNGYENLDNPQGFAQPIEILQAANGLEALALIFRYNPDIILLDIQMPEISGFEVLQHLKDRNIQVIFQTAFDEYAVKAFEESACDYLLKPFTQVRLYKALDKAFKNQDQNFALKQLECNLLKNQFFIENITYKKNSKLFLLKVNDIIYFISRDHYTSAITHEGEQIIDFSIAYLMERLNPNHFFRCHRNCIVSLKHIKLIGRASESELVLLNGFKIPVSRNRRSSLIKQISSSTSKIIL